MIGAVTVPNGTITSESRKAKIHVMGALQGNEKTAMSVVTFVVGSQQEQKKVVSFRRQYKIVGDYLVWKDRENHSFKYIKLFDQSMSQLEARQQLIELDVKRLDLTKLVSFVDDDQVMFSELPAYSTAYQNTIDK